MQVSKYWTANNEFNAIIEEYDRNPNALVTDNPNCVGWVSVADTRIDYPVMYTPNDPEYYLHRNFEGNEIRRRHAVSGQGLPARWQQRHHLRPQHERRQHVREPAQLR